MAKKELNLFEFASCAVAKASAGAAKVVRCEMFDADPFGISLYGGPYHVGSYTRSQFRPVSPDSPKMKNATQRRAVLLARESNGLAGLRTVSSMACPSPSPQDAVNRFAVHLLTHRQISRIANR